MELLIGCGSTRDRRIKVAGRQKWTNLVTLDIVASHKPDVIADLNDPLPFKDNTFNEIHAYEVLEHLGQQGDYKSFFAQFSELWRILEPDGILCGTTPSLRSPWLWGDPSHTRYIGPESFVFLSQAEYKAQVGKTAISDFRSIYSADFETVYVMVEGYSFHFALKALK